MVPLPTEADARRIRVLVVEDSPVTARVLRDILGAAPDLSVLEVARDGIAALEFLKAHQVDVVTLDVNMPNLGGIETLREIVRLHRLPCLMVSSVTTTGARTTLDALAAGAVDFFAKPRSENPTEMIAVGELLREKVRAVAGADVTKLFRMRPELVPQSFRTAPIRDLVVLGASTGGPRTLEVVLACFPSDLPAGFVIAQHLPVGFGAEFAARLDGTTQLTVREGKDFEEIEHGVVLVAPAGKLTTIEKGKTRLRLRVREPAEKPRYSPSVDLLFESAAQVWGAHTIGVVLTGMGDDGARGMEALHDAGAATLAESEASSVVFAMPGAAIARGVVRTVVSKELMAEEILHRMRV